MLLNKKEFVSAMDDIRDTYRFQKSLLACYDKNHIEGYLVQPDCAATALRLIHNIYKENDKADWIDTFCYELDFGRQWKKGKIKDNAGKEIKLENSEDLYSLLAGGDTR